MALLQMLVVFAPTNDMAYIPQHVPKAFGSGTADFPVVPNQFGGEMTSGSFRAYDAKGGKGHLVWRHAQGNAFYDAWEMDSKAAAELALANIAAELLEAEPAATITIRSDGTLGS